MDEEKDLPSPEPQESESPPVPPRPRPSRRKQQRSRQSVFQYIAVLFAASFILLLFTFLMERRQHEQQQEENQEQITNLQNSVSGLQSLKGLLEENETLKARVAELESELEAEQRTAQELNIRLDGLTDTLSHTENVLEWTKQAMDLFWQIDEAYVRGKTKLCRELIEQLESPDTQPAAGLLKDWLPGESTTDTGRFSPYDRYMEIRGKVIK